LLNSVDVYVQAGMLVTVEPGYYEPGGFGIRIENVAEVVTCATMAGKEFLGLKPLTLVCVAVLLCWREVM
jgi:Xaa-Pro aminopeptidase